MRCACSVCKRRGRNFLCVDQGLAQEVRRKRDTMRDPGICTGGISNDVRQMRAGIISNVSRQHRIAVPLIAESCVWRDTSRVGKRRERPHSPSSGPKEISFVTCGDVNIETDRQACLFTLLRLKFAPENHVTNAEGCVVIEKAGM